MVPDTRLCYSACSDGVSLLIRGGRVVDPSQHLDAIAHVYVDNGKVKAIVRPDEPQPSPRHTIDARGLVVCPGFLDVHCHLRFPGHPDKETIASGTSAAVRGGFTTVCGMANARPAVDTGRRVQDVLSMAEVEARCSVAVVGAVSRELGGRQNTDASELAASGAIALSDDGNPIMDSEIMTNALRWSDRLGIPVSVHEEVRLRNASIDPYWPCGGEVEMVRRDLRIVAQTGGKLHIAHVSCARSVELISDAQARGLPVTAEVTPHHLTLMGEKVTECVPKSHGSTKVNPPLRSNDDVMAVREGLRSGVIGMVATDHAPHSASDKAGGIDRAAFGFTGLETALPLLLELVERRSISLSTAIERLTAGPARAFGLKGGSLRAGSPADICIFDPDNEWIPARDTLVSKGKNTPLRGRGLKGRVRATIVGGRLHNFPPDHALRALRAS